MSGKKSTAKKKAPKLEEPQTQETKPTEAPPAPQEESITTAELTPELTPEPEPTPTPTIEQLYEEVQTLKHLALEHAQLIAHRQEALARERKPVQSNGKIQIHDKQTGQVYPSKNNAYQSLLKSVGGH